MKLAALAFAAAAASACALGSARVETQSASPSFHADALVVAAPLGAGAKGEALARATVRRLEAGGVKASSLAESDSVVAGADLGLDISGDPRVLAEIRRATGADGIVFLTLSPKWRALDVAVLDSATGDVVLRASARPDGDAFASVEDAASAAAEALSRLAPERLRAAAAAREGPGDLPVPDVDGGE